MADEYVILEPEILDPNKVAEDILRQGRNSLFVQMRFLSQAIHMLTPKQDPLIDAPVATDGEHLFYNTPLVLKHYVADTSWGSSAWLHMLLHCMFSHLFFSRLVDQTCWDLACDIAVAAAAEEFHLGDIACTPAMQSELARLRANHPSFAAHRLYEDLLDGAHSAAEMERLARIFRLDDHKFWYQQKGDKGEGKKDDKGKPSLQFVIRCKPGEQGEGEVGLMPVEQDQDGNGTDDRRSLAEQWKDISLQVQVDLETFSKLIGSGAGCMMQSLRAVTREQYDYAEFLRKFASLHETMRVDEDSFDYIFYTYGLQKYGNMPLIEPLEYKDVPLVKEFVIAIDTSGSTSGELVQTFLQKTYNILKSTESFTTHVNIRILQCDTIIQDDVKITSQQELENYIRDLKIYGHGGTDFRPVFEHVDHLIADREFQNLKGLIYFTDGQGVFPTRAPKYKSAFVFIDDEDNNYQVPAWAIKLVLRKNEV